MAITSDVKNQLFKSNHSGDGELIRLPSPVPPFASNATERENMASSNTNGRAWTVDEHNRFLEGLELFPSGPWKKIAAHVGSRTTRQTMTHAQKYREKIARRKRGLRSSVKTKKRSFKRRHDHQQQQTQAHMHKETTSPCSVAGPTRGLRKNVDPMDFHGCFVPNPIGMLSPCQLYDMNPIPEDELTNFAAMLSDFDPLPMSEEEIDLILEAATNVARQPTLTRPGFVL